MLLAKVLPGLLDMRLRTPKTFEVLRFAVALLLAWKGRDRGGSVEMRSVVRPMRSDPSKASMGLALWD